VFGTLTASEHNNDVPRQYRTDLQMVGEYLRLCNGSPPTAASMEAFKPTRYPLGHWQSFCGEPWSYCLHILQRAGCTDFSGLQQEMLYALQEDGNDYGRRGSYGRSDGDGSDGSGGPRSISEPLLQTEKGAAINRITTELEERHYFAVMPDTGDIFVRDEGLGYFVKEGERIVENELERDYPEIANTIVQEVLEKIRRRNMKDRHLFDSDPAWFHCENGWVNVTTKEFVDGHPPEMLSFVKLPHRYDPDATNPEQRKFFEQVFEPDDLPVVQKFFGYLLLPNQRFKKAFICVGLKDSGKSKFLELCERFIGSVSHVSLHDMAAHNHKVAKITKSILNTTSELPKYKLKDVSFFKSLTGGDEQTFREIYGHPFNARPRAKFLMAANQLPDFDDMDPTFIDRWIVFRFENVFEAGVDLDPHIIDKITTPAEMSGLLNFAVEGLEMLLKDGYFKNEGFEDVKAKWTSISSKISDYVDKYLEVKAKNAEVADSYVIGTELFNHYTSKTEKPVTENIFGREIKKYGVKHTRQRVVEDKRPRWVYEGVRFKKQEDADEAASRDHSYGSLFGAGGSSQEEYRQ
jgi:P4 family phage/plasmid primase-like protien